MAIQTLVEKEKGSHGFIADHFGNRNLPDKDLKAAIGYLCDDYAAAIRIASNLGSHSRWIPYPFLSNRLKKIAEEVRNQVELFRAEIVSLGAQPPQVEVREREILAFRENIKRLVHDVDDHETLAEQLVHQRNKTTLQEVVDLLAAVVLDMERQKDELTDIVMRLS